MNGGVTARPGSMTAAEFIAARLGEWQAAIRESEQYPQIACTLAGLHLDRAPAVRQVTAMRAILAEHQIGRDPCDAHDASLDSVPCDTVLHLAAIWADHEQYDESWRS